MSIALDSEGTRSPDNGTTQGVFFVSVLSGKAATTE